MRKTSHKTLRTKAAILALMALISSMTRAQQSGTATLTLPNMPLHDPWILANESDKTYYLYRSNVAAMSGVQGAGTMVYRSQDLKHWQKSVLVFSASEMQPGCPAGDHGIDPRRCQRIFSAKNHGQFPVWTQCQ
jgi:sucrose-6-phosphate hydrolase SacC (GH32 family)